MAFARKEQALVEASRKIRLERGDLRGVHALMAGRARREAVDLGRVARRRDDQRSLADDAGDPRRPPIDCPTPKLDHARRRALALAERREHAAGQP